MKNLIREGGKILTLRHMKIFTTVYRCGSVTRAAQELHLAQPSLSVAIRELEEHYGVRLFERTGRAHIDFQRHDFPFVRAEKFKMEESVFNAVRFNDFCTGCRKRLWC